MKLLAQASLRTRLMVALLVVGLIPAGLLTWGALSGASFVAQQQEGTLRSAAVTTLDKIDRNLFERYGDVQAFASHPALQNRDYWYKPENPIATAANRYAALYGCYPLMVVVDTTGKVIAANDHDATGRPIDTNAIYQRNYRGAAWFTAVLRNQFLTGPQGLTGTVVQDEGLDFDPRQTGGTGRLAVAFAAPVKNPAGQVIAIWLNYADFSLVDEILASTLAGLKAQGLDTAQLKLTSRAGRELATTGAAVQGERLSSSAHAKGALGYAGLGWKLAISVQEDQAMAFVHSLQQRIAAANAFSLLAILGLALLLASQISRPLRDAVSHLQSSTTQMQTSSEQVAGIAAALAHSSTSQAASIEETSAAMHEITTLIRHHAENSQQTSLRTGASRTAVADAQKSLGSLELSMTEMQEAAAQIARILQSIESIAYQTNILALNAAVEAARAGEAGLGFAVVAGEVRRLAQTAANASQETAPLVERAIATATASHDRLRLVGSSFHRIHEDVQELLKVVDEVSRGTAEQSRGVAEIEIAMLRIQKDAEVSAASAGLSAQAGAKLLDCASNTQGVVSGLEALLAGV